MGIRIDGNNDLINAADGSLTVEGLSIDVTGIVTASGGYKVGSAYTVFSNGNVATAGVVTTTKLQVNSATNTAAEFKGAGGAGFIGIRDGDDSTLAFIGVDAGVLKFQTSGSSYSDKLTIATDGKATFTGITTVSGETLFAKQLSLTGVTTSSNKFHINSLGIGMVPIDHQHIHVEAANPRILIRSTGTNAAKIHFGDSGANDRGIIEYNHSSDNMRFGTAGTEDHLVIDSNGKILVNHTSARQVAGGNSLIQVESNDSTGRISIVQNRNEASGAPFLSLGKSRGTAVGGTTIVQDGDTVGTVAFAGSDGTDFPSVAQIIGQVDGTPGNNDMPGRLIFKTCPDNSDSTQERMRIDNHGRVMIGNDQGSTQYADGGDDLVIGNTSGSHGITVISQNNNVGRLMFSDTYSSGTGTYEGQILYSHASNTMNFYANYTANQNIAMTIGGSNGDVTVQGGNLIIGTAGKGIDFSAQTTTSQSNTTVQAELLNHYEEGTWTPRISSTSGAGTVTHTQQHGRYTRIGNVVHAYFKVEWNSGSGSGDLILHDFPFTCASSAGNEGTGAAMFYNVNLRDNAMHTITYIGNGVSYAYFYSSRDAAAWYSTLFDAAGAIISCVSYRVD